MTIRSSAVVAVLLCLMNADGSAETRRAQDSPAHQAATRRPDLRGTDRSPLHVIIAPSGTAAEERAADEAERHEHAQNEMRIADGTDLLAYATCVLAGATTLLWIFTATLWLTTTRAARASDRASRDQLAKMDASVAEANRAAAAMERVAEATANNASLFQALLAKQMRAYLAIAVAGAVYQDKSKGLRFEGVWTISNTGMTPAHRVRHRSKAAILRHPLPQDFVFTLPDEPDGGPVLNARETYTVHTVVEDFVPDEEIAEIKKGVGRALYVWGAIAFDDELGVVHSTKFCHFYIWYGEGESERPNGYYFQRHNEAT